ncbi:MAG: hypothetical protein WCG45_05490, partial [bacterium]
MIAREHILNLHLTEAEIITIIAKAKENINIAQLDNLRNRHPNIQFDCMIRGYVGEFVIVKWLEENGIEFKATNHILE